MTEIWLVQSEVADDDSNNHNGKKLLQSDIKWLRSISLATIINNVNNNNLRYEEVQKILKHYLTGLLLATNRKQL